MKQMAVDGRVLAFTVGICILVACLLFGLVPALKASRTDLNTTLKELAAGSEAQVDHNAFAARCWHRR